MWASPNYFQSACDVKTTLILFGQPVTVFDLNHNNSRIWEGWAAGSIAITFLFAAFLYLSATSQFGITSRTARVNWMRSFFRKYDKDGDYRRVAVLSFASILCTCIALSNEFQTKNNCLLTNGPTWDSWSFGQVRSFQIKFCNIIDDAQISLRPSCLYYLHSGLSCKQNAFE